MLPPDLASQMLTYDDVLHCHTWDWSLINAQQDAWLTRWNSRNPPAAAGLRTVGLRTGRRSWVAWAWLGLPLLYFGSLLVWPLLARCCGWRSPARCRNA